jgi:hypothetical protein
MRFTIDANVHLNVALTPELDALRQETQIGIDDLESGAYTDYDEDTLPQLVEDIKARGLERLRAEEIAFPSRTT